jgi:hypothetical protein
MIDLIPTRSALSQVTLQLLTSDPTAVNIATTTIQLPITLRPITGLSVATIQYNAQIDVEKFTRYSEYTD